MLAGIRSRLTYANRPAGRVALAIFALTVAGLIAFGAGQASASHVSCGDTITADTTLDSDLAACPNNGIVIGADDITLDLNGHRIDGDGTEFVGCAKDEICDAGVLNDGHDGVTVRDGSVRQFAVGVLVRSARENRVLSISSAKHVFFGLVAIDSARGLIRSGSFSRNIPPEGDGIGLFGSHRLRIVNNKIRRNPGPGIHAEDSPSTLIKGNLFSRNSPGLFIQGDRNQVRRNHFVQEGGLLVAPGNGNVIAENRISGGGEILIEEGRRTLVARNVVVDAHRAGILLGIPQPPIGGGNNVVRRNLVRGSGTDGFLVSEKDQGSLLTGNTAVDAGAGGFDIRGPATRLRGNLGVRNATHGIKAVLGVIDGGGNKAHGNGASPQCINIACK